MHIQPDILARFLSQLALLNVSLAKGAGLNAFQLLTLMLVGASSVLSIKDLKGKLAIPGSSLTFTIDSLENKGLLRRERSREDRRQWFLSLSTKGAKLYTQVVTTESDLIAPALNRLSGPEKKTFVKIAEAVLDPEGDGPSL